MRAALRVVPLVTLVAETGPREKTLALLTLRAILTSWVATVQTTPEVRAAARAARAAYAAGAADAADAAAYADAERAQESLAVLPVEVPQELSALYARLARGRTDLLTLDGWDFWAEWYARAMAGDPLPWDLQRDIALIPDQEWQKGPERIADMIREIRRRHDARDLLPEEPTRTHVRTLLKTALITEMQARGLQQLVQMAIDAYRREVSNALPDALVPLEQLPPILDQIVCVLAGEAPRSGKERALYRLVQDMARTVSALNSRLGLANAEIARLTEAMAPLAGRRLFAEAFYTKAGEGAAGLLTSKVLWGGILAGAAVLMGTDADALVMRLGDCARTLIEQNAPDVGSFRLPAS